MSQEGTSMKSESIEALTREAEALKHKLEEERQKLNDVTCKFQLNKKRRFNFKRSTF